MEAAASHLDPVDFISGLVHPDELYYPSSSRYSRAVHSSFIFSDCASSGQRTALSAREIGSFSLSDRFGAVSLWGRKRLSFGLQPSVVCCGLNAQGGHWCGGFIFFALEVTIVYFLRGIIVRTLYNDGGRETEDGIEIEGLGDMETRRFGEGETKSHRHSVTKSPSTRSAVPGPLSSV